MNFGITDNTRDLFRAAQCDLSKISLGPQVNRNFHLCHPANLTIAEGAVLNGDCFIDASGGVSIGKCTHIAQECCIYSSNHNWRSDEFVPYGNDEILKPVKIGDCVWICARVSIAPGVTIGNGAIVSMGSVIFEDVPECAIVKGNPAEVVGYRDKEAFADLYAQGKMI